ELATLLAKARGWIAHIGRMTADVARVSHNQPQANLVARLYVPVTPRHVADRAGGVFHLFIDGEVLPNPIADVLGDILESLTHESRFGTGRSPAIFEIHALDKTERHNQKTAQNGGSKQTANHCEGLEREIWQTKAVISR